MSYTHIRKISNTREAVEYEELGSRYSVEWIRHRREGTDRIAAMRCDAPSLDDFVEQSEALAEAHGRKVEALSIIQSFERHEFDVGSSEDVQRVNDLGYELAKRQWPNSDALVITHTDSAGGHLHNHIKVVNHDREMGKALWGTSHRHLGAANDDLMREHGLRVIEKWQGRGDPWEVRRDVLEEKEDRFAVRLGDTIYEALKDSRAVDEESYRAVLGEAGISIKVTDRDSRRKGKKKSSPEEAGRVGWTYEMHDEESSRKAKRRRKASSLSVEFTRESVEELFEWKKERAMKRAGSRKEFNDGHQGRHHEGGGAGAGAGVAGAVGVVDGPGRAVGEDNGVGVGVYVPRGRARASDAADAGAEQVDADDRGSAGDDLEAVRRQLRERRLRLERDGRPAAADHRRDGRDRRRDEPAARKAQRDDLDAFVEQSLRGFRRPAGEKDRGGLELDF